MAVNLYNADSALKSYYLDAVAEQLNFDTNPFLAVIKQTTEDVWGKEVKKLVVRGVNGGVGAGTEEGNLPGNGGNNYAQFVTTLKNLYGTIQISDKAVRASENNAGAFVNLLNAEMEGLVKSSSFNLGRMLFGDGSGVLATVVRVTEEGVTVSNVNNLVEGMVVDFCDRNGVPIFGFDRARIHYVNRKTKQIKLNFEVYAEEIPDECYIVVQDSFNKEITGLGAIFDLDRQYLYGIKRVSNEWINPYIEKDVGAIDEMKIQKAIDTIEENSGSKVNFIMCSWGVRRALQKLLSTNRQSDTVELAGGYKAITFNGIPVVVDRFCPEGTMYLLNTNDFQLHQLCDWQWLEGDDGKVLKQIPGKPVYTATLVKYADLICSNPGGQGMLTGITEE